jgi:hypothetical protein
MLVPSLGVWRAEGSAASVACCRTGDWRLPGAWPHGKQRTPRTDFAQRDVFVSAEGRREPRRASRERPRDAGGLPAFGRQPRIEAARRSASRRERLSGLRSSARHRSAAAPCAATPPLAGWNTHRCPRHTNASAVLCHSRRTSKAALCARPLRALLPQETSLSQGWARRAPDIHHRAANRSALYEGRPGAVSSGLLRHVTILRRAPRLTTACKAESHGARVRLPPPAPEDSRT